MCIFFFFSEYQHRLSRGVTEPPKNMSCLRFEYVFLLIKSLLYPMNYVLQAELNKEGVEDGSGNRGGQANGKNGNERTTTNSSKHHSLLLQVNSFFFFFLFSSAGVAGSIFLFVDFRLHECVSGMITSSCNTFSWTISVWYFWVCLLTMVLFFFLFVFSP